MSLSQLIQQVLDPSNLPYIGLVTGTPPNNPWIARIGEQIIAGAVIGAITLYGMVQVLDAKFDMVQQQVRDIKQDNQRMEDRLNELTIQVYRSMNPHKFELPEVRDGN